MEFLLMDTDGIHCLVNQIGCHLGDNFILAEDCIDTLEQLLHRLKNEKPERLHVSRMLGLLEVVEKTIIPLIINLDGSDMPLIDKHTILNLTSMLLVRLTLPIESHSSMEMTDASVVKEIKQYKEHLKHAAVDSTFIKAFVGWITKLVHHAKGKEDAKLFETVNNGLLFIRNILFIQTPETEGPPKWLNSLLLHTLFEGGLHDLIIQVGLTEDHVHWHSALIEIISVLYNDQNFIGDKEIFSKGKTEESSSSGAPEYVCRTGNCSSEESPMSSPRYMDCGPSPSLPGEYNPEISDNLTDPSKEGGQWGENEEEERMEEASEGASCCALPQTLIGPLANRLETFERGIYFSYFELLVKQKLAVLLESLLKDGVFNNLVKGLVSSCVACGMTSLPDLYLSWFIFYFLQFVKKFHIRPALIRSCLSVEVVSYLTHVGVLTCEAMVSNYQRGVTNELVHSRNLLVIHALRSIFSTLQYFWEDTDLTPAEDTFLLEFADLMLQMSDVRFLLLMCIRNFNSDHQALSYLRDVVMTNHKFLILAEYVMNSPQTVCRFNMLEHVQNFACNDMMAKYGLLLEDYMEESPATLECVFTLMHHVAGDCMSPRTLLQLPIIEAFLAILDSKITLKQETFELISFIVQDFLSFAESDPFACAVSFYQQSNTELNLDEGTRKEENYLASSSDGDSRSDWEQDDLDELYVIYQRFASLPFSEQLRRVTEELAESNIHKSEIEVKDQLVRQGLMTDCSGEMSDESTPPDVSDVPCPSINPSPVLEITAPPDLLDTLSKQADKLMWMQRLLLEVCYVKIGGRNVGKKQEPEEPIPLFYTIQSKPVPLIPFRQEQEAMMNDFFFRLSLEKLGFLPPQDSSQIYPRIPYQWTPKHLLSMAKALGPINFEEQKFCEADVNKCLFKQEMRSEGEQSSSDPSPSELNALMPGPFTHFWHVFIQQSQLAVKP